MNDYSTVQSRARRGAPRARATTARRPTATEARGPLAERVRRALADHGMVERLTRNFKALGDPTRSRLVLALSLSELCVSDLAEALGASLSATSHQLRILRDLGLVKVRRVGKSQLYTLNDEGFGPCSPRLCAAWRPITRRPAGANTTAR